MEAFKIKVRITGLQLYNLFTVKNNTLQFTVVMAQLKIASMNYVRRIGNNNKRRETFN